MSLIELLLFVLGIALSVLVGRCFYGKVGWWGVPLALIAGFGSLYGLILLLDRVFPPRAVRERQQNQEESGMRDPVSRIDQWSGPKTWLMIVLDTGIDSGV
jgi:hypothetical protein